MKKFYFCLSAIASIFLFNAGFAQSGLLITGVVDGPLTGGLPKAIEVYALNDIADLSAYGLGSANNGGGTDGEEFTFPADAVTAGTFIYITTDATGDAAAFEAYLGFAPDYQNSFAGINGDDAIELFFNGAVVDVFGEIDVDGTGQAWEYLDGWAYRNDGATASTAFNVNDWSFSGINALDNTNTNAEAASPFPVGTYSTEGGGGDDPVPATITEIQETLDQNGDSPLLDVIVTTSGIVTAVFEDGYWIQDGTGPWSGIFIDVQGATVAQGDDVTVTGLVTEQFGLTRLDNVTEEVINSNGNALPAPSAVSTVLAGTEDYESVLVSLSAVTCTDDNLGFGEWEVNDGSGPYRVDDLLYNANPQLLVGYDLTGIAYWSFSNFKLLPRDADDVVINADASELGLSFEAAELSFNESAGSVTISIEIINPASTATTVEVVTAGGTAENGTHYDFTSPAVVTFPADDATAQTFTLDLIDDVLENADRTIIFTLQNATNDAVLIDGEIIVTILDDDAEVVITPIATAAANALDGSPANQGEEFTITGLVYGVNTNPNGLQFTLIDETGGVGVFSSSPVSGYSVNEGDSILLTGTVGFFNGLTQMNPSAIQLISQNNDLQAPLVVTELGENTESQLVKLECLTIVDPGQWTNSGSGFNVTVTNGTDEFAMRIDNDVNLYGTEPPTGTFNLTGIGGQFDNSQPYFDGYQILPRYVADIEATECPTGPVNDACADAIIIDALFGGGIGLPNTSGAFSNLDATSEGDPEPDCFFGTPTVSNTIWFTFVGDGEAYFIETVNCGEVSDYIDDGDTQMSIYTGSCDNLTEVACNEDGPNSTPTEYPAGLTLQTEEGVSYLVMIDGYEGAQGEFCIEVTAEDVDGLSEENPFELVAFPNPANGQVTIESGAALENVSMTNVLGQRVKEWTLNSTNRIVLNTEGIEPGVYILQAESNDLISTLKLVIE